MAASLKTKLAGKESEIIKAIKELNISGAMHLYGIKTRYPFLKWVRENTNGEWQPTPLSEFKGGEKQKFLREHKDTILDCLEIFGREWVKDQFGMIDDTIDSLIHRNGTLFTQKLTRLERVELDAKEALAIARELKKQMEIVGTRFEKEQENTTSARRQFREHMEQHDDSVQAISERLSQIIALGLRDHIKPLPQSTDPLNIVELVAQAKPHLPEQEQLNTSEKKATKTRKRTRVTAAKPEESPLTSIEAPPRAVKEGYMAAHPFAEIR